METWRMSNVYGNLTNKVILDMDIKVFTLCEIIKCECTNHVIQDHDDVLKHL